MITSIGKQAVAAATVVAAAGLTAQAAAHTARAAGFSTAYTCSGPMLGTRTAVLDGWLTSPGQAAVNRPVDFQLHVASLGLGAPYPLHSWTASARVGVGGAENTAFRVTGSGESVPLGESLSGDLPGRWTPLANGTHELTVGAITIDADTPAGGLTAYCVPSGPHPVAATLTVFPVFQPAWDQPVAPPYGVEPPYSDPPPYNVAPPYTPEPPFVAPYPPGGHRPGGRPPHHHHGRPHHPHGR
ncbi:hypothetical protein [Actinomadura sp. DC4]|uniref:hypothetical protein n=1 Tax=Actinomadura sp. DC4 TaxID=3055069 RepID=UPI0025B0AC81|nr:hypothetical protein [Actinomadura sp. DC4]MDN3359667.1 hypothetical protein [Actinomadura sp. DC4]